MSECASYSLLLGYETSMNVLDELMGVAAALEGASVDYAHVGGLAVAVWGAARATKDIDLLVRPERLA